MIRSEHGALLGGSAKPAARAEGRLARAWRVIYKASVIVEADLRKLRHDPIELFMRIMQPVLWLGVFGVVFARVRAVPDDVSAHVSYLDFMAPGVIAQSALFLAIFSGLTIIMERDLGMLQKMIATPTSYISIVAGKAVAAGVRGLLQSVLVFFIALVFGAHLSYNPWHLAAAMLVMVVGTATFATISIVIATLVRARERMMGLGQVITMPMFFASNALYPIALMPIWLKALAQVNPLSYEVDALRGC